MKLNKAMLIAGAGAALVVTLGLLAGHHQADPSVATGPVRQPAAAPVGMATEPPPPSAIPALETGTPVQAAEANIPQADQPKKSGASSGKPARVKAPIQDAAARAALSFVGADPGAEAYWMGAINDPNLPAEERKDLIEDLNEDGLSDPQHPGPQDLPLIVNRLQLLEELAPYAMDRVNADAFAEAYKDLNDMLAGRPVK